MTRRDTREPSHLQTSGAAWGLATAAGVLFLLGVSTVDGRAQEIGPFRLTGMEGSLSTRYVLDDFATRQHATGQAAGTHSRQTQATLREELLVMTHGYVYHPNFLTLDLGGGPILQYGTFTTDSTSTESIDGLYNLTGRATFLREKPYHGSLFYEHLNPTVSVSPGQVLSQENTRYGLDFSLLSPVTPVPLEIDATRIRSQGSGADRVIDERIDRLGVRATRILGTVGTTQAQYQGTWQESLSGSPNLPIQGSRSTNQSLGLDTRLHFGARQQYEVLNLVSLTDQTYHLGQGSLPDRHDARVLLDGRADVTPRLHTSGAYSFSRSDQGTISSTLHSGSVGLSHELTDQFTTAAGLRGDDSRTGDLMARSWGVDGSVRYQRPLLLGVAQASYAVRFDQRAQASSAPETRVIGESITLKGLTQVALVHPRVVPGSVVVSNATRTQTFAEGPDYTLTQVGQETRAQRVLGGSIVDGQDLLVDYAYDTGGTFGSVELGQTLALGWSLSRYLGVHYRHLESWPSVTSGTPSTPLNTVHSDLYGVRVDVPFRLGLALAAGGTFEQEFRRETIDPSRRESFTVYAQNEEPLLDMATARVGMHGTRVDHDRPTQNVNLLGYDAQLWLRHPIGLDLAAEASWERDTGGLVARTRLTGSLKAQWRFRRVVVVLDVGVTRETQGPIDRTRTLLQLELRREF